MIAKIVYFLNNFNLILLGLFLFSFPLIFTTLTTDAFSLPKQFALAAVCLVGLLIFGVRSLTEKSVKYRRTPLNFPVLLFILTVFASSVLSLNKSDSLTAFASLLFAALLYFLLVNFARTKKAVFLLIAAFFEGAVILSIFYILSFFKVYILPFEITHSQVFSPLGTLLDQAIYLFAALALVFYYIRLWRQTKITKEQKKNIKFLGFVFFLGLKTLVILFSLGLTIYSLLKLQNPFILPLSTGFQIGFAAISQDTSRFILNFLLGSGFGTFAADFARFKQAAFNQNPLLWNLTFFRSSSFVLEILATTGVLGLLSFIYLSFRIIKARPLFHPLVALLILSFLLPFSAITLILFFVLLSLHTCLAGLSSKEYYDLELGVVAFKNGLVKVTANEGSRHALPNFLNLGFFVLLSIFTGLLGFLVVTNALANASFQKSFLSENQNKAVEVYQLRVESVKLVPYNDVYQRVLSQTNLVLANNLLQRDKNSSPSAQTVNTAYSLIQESINLARRATELGPLSPINWENLSSIYRSLIGFGRNADEFSTAAQQQAILRDPVNPNQYINQGGLYYKLQEFTKAEAQFRIAVSLKPDYPNAHYNLAHALQEKGDLKGALEELELVKALVKKDPINLKKIEGEINLLKSGIEPEKKPAGEPSTNLPSQNPQISIPAPTTPTPTPTPVASPTPTPTTAPLQ